MFPSLKCQQLSPRPSPLKGPLGRGDGFKLDVLSGMIRNAVVSGPTSSSTSYDSYLINSISLATWLQVGEAL